MASQFSHILGDTCQNIHISLTRTPTIFLNHVVDEKVIKIVGKSKIVIVKIQFHTEMESVLCREIAFENIDAALELILP
jgi:hypothetical protein